MKCYLAQVRKVPEEEPQLDRHDLLKLPVSQEDKINNNGSSCQLLMLSDARDGLHVNSLCFFVGRASSGEPYD